MTVGMFSDRSNDVVPSPARVGHRVWAAVVTYHPGPEVPENIGAILRQVARVIIVDNEATEESRERLLPCVASAAVDVIENTENLGIAAAFNQGLKCALAGECDWVATFDQDSRVPDGYIAALLAGHADHRDKAKVAVLAPLFRDRHLGFVYSPNSGQVRDDEARNLLVPVTASSGNLVSTAAFGRVGGFREDFFMACVDFEFCLRCRRAGWLVLEVRSAVLDHEMGRYRQRRWLWLEPRLNDYDATRRYYQARNLLILYACYGWFDPRWMIRNAWYYSRDLMKLVMFGENRRIKLNAVFRGWWHAATARRGRCDGVEKMTPHAVQTRPVGR